MDFDAFADKEEVLQIINESWIEVNSKQAKFTTLGSGSYETKAKVAGKGSAGTSGKVNGGGATKSGGYFGSLWSGGKTKAAASTEGHEGGQAEQQFDIPDTFEGMCRLNASMTGANHTYINIMLDGFGILVEDVCETGQLREQTDILAMRICKDVSGKFSLSQFKVCMLASLRSLLPSRWDTKHEKAWSWLWESIEVQLKQTVPLPAKYEHVVKRWVQNLQPEDVSDIGMRVWQRLFALDPQAERFFKQSNQRLIFIARSAIEFSAKIYSEPTAMNIQMQELGLKHIFHKVEPKYFPVFVQCMEQEIRERTDDENISKGISWSLSVIACIMGRTVEAGSTQILMATLSNNAKEVQKLLNQTARGKRSDACLKAEAGRSERGIVSM